MLVILVTAAFFGLAVAAVRMLALPARPPRGEPSAWMVVPVVAGAVVLMVLGVHPPAELNHLLARAVRELSGGGA